MKKEPVLSRCSAMPSAFSTLDPGEEKEPVKVYFCFFYWRVLEALTMCSVSWSTFIQSWGRLFVTQRPCPVCAIYPHPETCAVCSFTQQTPGFQLFRFEMKSKNAGGWEVGGRQREGRRERQGEGRILASLRRGTGLYKSSPTQRTEQNVAQMRLPTNAQIISLLYQEH